MVLSLGMLLGSSQGSSGPEPVPAPEVPHPCESVSESNSGPLGTWGCEFPRAPHLTLNEDGGVGGHDGCNAFSGRWGLEGDTIVFPGWMTTLVDCGPDRDWLSGARTTRVDGDIMHFHDRYGNAMGSLARY